MYPTRRHVIDHASTNNEKKKKLGIYSERTLTELKKKKRSRFKGTYQSGEIIRSLA